MLSPQAVRYLALTYEVYGTREFAGCLLGRVSGDTAFVELVAPADVEAADTAHVQTPPKGCEAAGWPNLIGVVHSHPGGVRCSHFLVAPSGDRTQVPSSDWFRFLRYEDAGISMIYCGARLVWLDRADNRAEGERPTPTRHALTRTGGPE
jgi:hypothetical protein